MSHHGPNPLVDRIEEMKNKDIAEKLGATGNFPKGKLNKDDEGEIQFAIAADLKNKKVILDFGTPVAWVGLDPEQAKEIGEMLVTKANSLF